MSSKGSRQPSDCTTCRSCSSTYQDPRILSCLHSFCLRCISKMSQSGNPPTIICPTCTHPTPVPVLGADGLQRNIWLQDLSKRYEITSKVSSSSSPPCCSSCEESVPSVAFCADCKGFLCSFCRQGHQKIKALRSHTVFSLEQIADSSQDDRIKMPVIPTTCPDHDSYKLEFYCEKCAKVLCFKCSISSHKDHGVVEVNAEVTQKMKKMKQGMAEFDSIQEKLQQSVLAIVGRKEETEACKVEVDGMIKTKFAELQRVIDQRKEALLAENSQIAKAKEVRLSIQLETVQHLLNSAKQCQHLASSAASDEYSDTQFLSIANTLDDRAVGLQQQYTGTSFDLCETPDIFLEANTDTLVTMINVFGCVSDRSPSSSNTTAVIPRKTIAVGAEMKVRVVSRDIHGDQLDKGGLVVRGRLVHNDKKIISCPVTDNGDDTYLVTVVPKQVGQHQLSVIINSQSIQGSPFRINVVQPCDYTKITDPIKYIQCDSQPNFIAFSPESGKMFVTSNDANCIYTFDKSGNKGTTIGSSGSGELQFNVINGITISGEVVFVTENGGNRIQKITTGGEFLGTFGQEGSARREFSFLWDVDISPEGMVYVADCGNHRVQVFHPDWTVSHVIEGTVLGTEFCSPVGIAFDLIGNVHVTSHSSSVMVFSPTGKFIHQYGHIQSSCGIAIDPSGHSLVVDNGANSLHIYDPIGQLVHSITNINSPYGVAVAPDGSVWVTDPDNNRLVKY